jgi:hypothetical protein
MPRNYFLPKAWQLIAVAVVLGLGVTFSIAGLIATEPDDHRAIIVYLLALAGAALSAVILAALLASRRQVLFRTELLATKIHYQALALQGSKPPTAEGTAQLQGLVQDGEMWVKRLIEAGAYQQARALEAAIFEARMLSGLEPPETIP